MNPAPGIIHLILLALLAIPSLAVCAANPRDEIAFYIDSYGEVSAANDQRAAAAHRIFNRVRAVADKSLKRPRPNLVVIGPSAAPQALALPDGHVVLSRHALDICYEDAAPDEAEARIAFVLGHELAHLAGDDFWHHEVRGFLNGPKDQINRLLEGRVTSPAGELEADDKGFVYAGMAGFPVNRLLDSRAGGMDFFTLWAERSGAPSSPTHPRAMERANLLRNRLAELARKLDFFAFGVRLAHFGYWNDAIYFFEELLRVLPGREVLNNLGLAHLQIARRKMPPERVWHYWLPTVLDDLDQSALFLRGSITAQTTHLKQLAGTGGDDYLQEAAYYLQKATDADPVYLPARINLAAVRLYQGRPREAGAALEDTLSTQPPALLPHTLNALALYEQGRAGMDLWPTSVKRLEELAADPKTPAATLFNLARLLQLRPRPSKARSYWNKLAAIADQLPLPVLEQVCPQQDRLPMLQCARMHAQDSQPPPWSWPSADEPVSKDWEHLTMGTRSSRLSGAILKSPDETVEILKLDGKTVIEVVRGVDLGDAKKLSDYCPWPLLEQTLAQGTLHRCNDWAALAHDGKVAEVWRVVH